LPRALTTATFLFPHKPIQQIEALKERGLGVWEWVSKAEIHQKFPQCFLPSGSLNPHITPFQGEPIALAVERVYQLLRQVAPLLSHGPIIAVTHHTIIRIIHAILRQISLIQAFEEVHPYLTVQTIDLTPQILNEKQLYHTALGNLSADKYVLPGLYSAKLSIHPAKLQ
jgi:broad specificity phosphatase PhoE